MCRLAAAWADGVVPLGQNVVRFELQSLKLFRTGFGASGVMSAVQIGRNGQAGCRRGRTDKVKDLLVAIERFVNPVFGDFGEEAMLDGIPLGSANGGVSVGEEVMIIDQSGRAVPTGPRVFKVADHLALFGIDANDRHAAALEALA